MNQMDMHSGHMRFIRYMNLSTSELRKEYERQKRNRERYEAKRGPIGAPDIDSDLILALERKGITP